MKDLFKILCLAFCISSLTSCEDFFSTTLEVDPPEHIERLVVNAFGDTRTNTFKVSVAKSVGIFEDTYNQDLLINDATVTLIHNQTRYDLEPSPVINSRYNFYLNVVGFNFIKGDTYNLEVIADGFPTATAETIIPLNLDPISITYTPDGPSFDGQEYHSINVFVQDNADIDSYFEYTLLEKREDQNGTNYWPIYSETFDPVVEYGITNMLLKDDSFDGLEKDLELLLEDYYFENNPDLKDNLVLNWRNITEAQYRYSKSLDDFIENGDNPFLSPVQIFSNIDNGLGIFAISNEEYFDVN